MRRADHAPWPFCYHDTATTVIYPLSLHDALPISVPGTAAALATPAADVVRRALADVTGARRRDRKSTRLNSSHANISYAVFCLKKKKRGSGCMARRSSRCDDLVSAHESTRRREHL